MNIRKQISCFVKSIVSYETWRDLHIPETLLISVLFLLPFNIRLIWPATSEFMPGVNRDFISVILYAIDLPILFFSAYALFFVRPIPKPVWMIIVWLAAELIINPSKNIDLSVITSLHLTAGILFAFYVANQINLPKISRKLAFAGLIAGAIQSIIALLQFTINHSIGLKLIGESILSPNSPGVAKLVVSGETVIRGYGTMAHPNILGAFLLTSTLLGLYLLNTTYQNRHRFITYFLIILNVLGCFLTFSRATLAALVLATSIFWFFQRKFTRIRWQLIIIGISTILISTLLWSYLITRGDISGQSTDAREEYNKTAINIIINEGFFGAGPGQSLLHMKQYSSWIKEPWQVQPIHNYPLLLLTEIGIGGFIVFFIIFQAIRPNFPRFSIEPRANHKNSTWELMVWSLAIAFIFLSLFDHYFYTYWPTQILFWFIIGANLGSAKSQNN